VQVWLGVVCVSACLDNNFLN